MARVFPEDSPWLDKENVPESLEKIERYLRYMQERIEHDSYSKSVYDQRRDEEIALVVKRSGTSVAINDNNIVTQAQRVTDNETYTSSITQNANSINSIVQAVGANGTVTAASIVQAVNAAGSTVKISADHITLSGDVVLKSNLTDGSTQISGSNITTGTINAQNVNVTNINGQNVISAVANATNAAVANALNNTLSGFASMMMGYVDQATRTLSDTNGFMIGNNVALYGSATSFRVGIGNMSLGYYPNGVSSADGSTFYLTIYAGDRTVGIRKTSGGVWGIGTYTEPT